MAKTTSIASYLTDGNGHSASSGGTAGSKYVQVPCAAIGLDEADIDDFPEFINALIRTARTNFLALENDARPEHMRISKNDSVNEDDSVSRTFTVRLDVEYGDESVKDEA